MYNHILNARISGYQRSFHLMAYTVSFANRNGGINLNVQFLSAARIGKVEARGRIEKRGREVCYMSAELSQGGKVLATATAAAIIRKI